MSLLTPPLTPKTVPSFASTMEGVTPPISPPHSATRHRYSPACSSPLASPDSFSLPPALEDVPELEMPESSFASEHGGLPYMSLSAGEVPWRPNMTAQERDAREAWISGGRGRRGLRIVIVTENFLPKVDGVTRTLARLLEHLEGEGHSCMLLGPGTGMSHYASHPLVGTAGVPLVVYPGLKLNFLRPKFLHTIQEFQPDVVHFVDPIWLGAQTLMAMELGWAGQDWVGEGGPAIGTGISGAVVASYHTNLATYATLFGMAWLEPIMWRFQQWLYSKTRLTLCPSPSTKGMLESQSFSNVRLWPRGVDLSQFGPCKRSSDMRARWGVGEAPCRALFSEPTHAEGKHEVYGVHHSGRKTSLPLTPPASPVVQPTGGPVVGEPESLPSRLVILYVGRVSWEKNLILLLHAYGRLATHLPPHFPLPKLVFVGDGPARGELESICADQGYDATFMGHRQGQELAQCYASADIFAFPSFTETFGQVVLEALASGLPVVGLDAEGTRDLVTHASTGLLLPVPGNPNADRARGSTPTWPAICRDKTHPLFSSSVEGYASLLARACTDHTARAEMGRRACSDGIRGYTWWDAMERCVDGYREAVRLARARRAEARERDFAQAAAESVGLGSSSSSISSSASGSASASTRPRISRVNRALSRRLLVHRQFRTLYPEKHPRRRLLPAKPDAAETLWHLKTLAKVVLVAVAFWWIWSRHLASRGRQPAWDDVFLVA